MAEHDWLAEQFEGNRSAYRMLGSLAEADDAVQEVWLRLSRSDAGAIDNLGAWLTTVVARVCLDTLRSRTSLRRAVLDPDLVVLADV
jgi:RNA polymerase sigma-70 factor (ECF subfamily)